MAFSIRDLNPFNDHKYIRAIFGKTPYQKFLRFYFFVVLIGGILLYFLGQSNNGGSFLDSFFISISAFTNTGLSPKNISKDFGFSGQLIILLLIQLVGMGFLTVLVFVWAWFRKNGNISSEQKWFLHMERGTNKRAETIPVLKTGIYFLFVTELIGAIFLTYFFYFAIPSVGTNETNGDVQRYRKNFVKAMWAGIFHSISATNNAGFDILGKYSIIPYREGINNYLSIVLLIESIIGGIGYPVFYEIHLWRKAKKENKYYNFTLFSKIAAFTYIFVAMLAINLILLFECAGTTEYLQTTQTTFKWGDSNKSLNQVWNLIYMTFAARSSGFASIDPSQLSEPTKWLLSILMFIGTSPASTGGGIRTVTMFIVIAKMVYVAMGREYISIWGRTIKEKTVFDSYSVCILSLILVVVCSFLMMINNVNNGSGGSADAGKYAGDIMFEAFSAFGTTGLTSGFTCKSNWFGKIILMLLMFIGQLGVSNTLLSITDLKNKDKSRKYSFEDLRLA